MTEKILDTTTLELNLDELHTITSGLELLGTAEAMTLVDLLISEVERQKLGGESS